MNKCSLDSVSSELSFTEKITEVYEISRKCYDNPFDEDEHHSRIASIESCLGLKSFTNGWTRAVFKVEDYAIKVDLCTSEEYCNKAEADLIYHIHSRHTNGTLTTSERDELLGYLCPQLFSISTCIAVYPFCKDLKKVDMTEANKIIKRFADFDIILEDVSRPAQFAYLDGKLVLVDYSDWCDMKEHVSGESSYTEYFYD